MKPSQFLMAAAAAASLCCPISGASAGIPALADASVAGGSGPRERSEWTAFLSSFLGTGVLGGAGVLANSSNGNGTLAGTLYITAYMIGPSIGHFYAGRAGRAFVGIGIRSVALVGVGAAIISALNEDNNNDGTVLAIASLVVGGGSVLVDIATAPHSARVHNRKVRRSLAIGPASVGGAPGVRVDVGLF